MKLHPRIVKILDRIAKPFGLILHNPEKPHLPWPTSFSTVDIAIIDPYKHTILLGKKRATGRWCIIGGFTDASSLTDEEDAIRELKEETGIVAQEHELRYIGNFKIPDGRYENTPHAIRTHYYILKVDSDKVPSGPDAPEDPEIETTEWFSLKDRFDLIEGDDPFIGPAHKILISALKRHLGA